MHNDQLDGHFSPAAESGWFALPPDGSQTGDQPWEPPQEGSIIWFSGDDSVDVPLWSTDGLMFSVPEELVQEFGVSAELASDIVEWAHAWQSRSGESDHDAQAARLVRRLSRELNERYDLVYKP